MEGVVKEEDDDDNEGAGCIGKGLVFASGAVCLSTLDSGTIKSGSKGMSAMRKSSSSSGNMSSSLRAGAKVGLRSGWIFLAGGQSVLALDRVRFSRALPANAGGF